MKQPAQHSHPWFLHAESLIAKIQAMKRLFVTILVILWASTGIAQTIITESSTDTSSNSSAILDLRSTSKGFLPTRMTELQRLAISNLSEGLIVYQTNEPKGFYYFDGGDWKFIGHAAGNVVPVSKTTSDTLKNTETFIVASNDITLNLPDISGSDNGLSICIKNYGSHVDMVTVQPAQNSLIDGYSKPVRLYKNQSLTFVAFDGNWLIRDRAATMDNVFHISQTSSWTTIAEMLEFLSLHMEAPSVVTLSGGEFPISSTQTINLPYPLTIQGISYGASTITADEGLTNAPMFICETECYFKMLIFDGSTLTSYGTKAGEDCIRLTGDGVYYEIKDNVFQNFYRAVLLGSGTELWMFENDIYDCALAGVEVAAGSATPFLKLSEIDFYSCPVGVSLLSAFKADVAIKSCGFYCQNSGDAAVKYLPATFSYTTMHISGNTWNNIGAFTTGFDFARADGRDAMVYLQDNAGASDQRPMCKINVTDNTAQTSISNPNSWNKANLVNSSSIPVKFGVANNRMTYQPNNRRDVWIIITGDVMASSNNKTVSIAVAKNGVTSTLYGKTTVRLSSQGQSYQFSTVVLVQNITAGDYLELFCSVAEGYTNLTFSNVEIFANTR